MRAAVKGIRSTCSCPNSIIRLFARVINIDTFARQGISANITQYVVTSAAPEAPDFANGLFLSSANIGTTVGTAVGGLFISTLGIQYVILVGLLSAIVSVVFILIRNNRVTANK